MTFARPIVTVGAVVVLGALATPWAGCATPPGKAAPPSADAAGDLAAEVEVALPIDAATLRPAEAIDAERLFPLEPRETRWRITRGRGEGDLVVGRVERDGNIWRSILEGRQTATLQRNDDGDLVVLTERDQHEGVRVRYDPPVLKLPATVAQTAGTADREPHTGAVDMAVHNLADGSPRDHGRCGYRIEVLGQAEVRTAAGTFDAYLVRTTREIDLKLADVVVTIDTAYAPGEGAVAETVRRRVRALGLFGSESVQSMERAAPAE